MYLAMNGCPDGDLSRFVRQYRSINTHLFVPHMDIVCCTRVNVLVGHISSGGALWNASRNIVLANFT